jgi:hypothetical protein
MAWQATNRLSNDEIKPAWECVLLTAIRDEIKAGNLSVMQNKRFGRFAIFLFQSPNGRKRTITPADFG